MWDTVERLWSDTVARADRLPEAARHERVDDEWSLVETLRHLIFAVDVWVGRMLRMPVVARAAACAGCHRILGCG